MTFDDIFVSKVRMLISVSSSHLPPPPMVTAFPERMGLPSLVFALCSLKIPPVEYVLVHTFSWVMEEVL